MLLLLLYLDVGMHCSKCCATRYRYHLFVENNFKDNSSKQECKAYHHFNDMLYVFFNQSLLNFLNITMP